MPEGPEVRRYADTLHAALAGKPIETFSARTRAARAWLEQRPEDFAGRRVERVWSHGKNLVGSVEGNLYFYSHLLMWGRWTVTDEPPAPDRRERARIGVSGATAVLLSAPIFEVGQGDPYRQIEPLGRLGPDILPTAGPAAFDRGEFERRLRAPENGARTVGAALLDQTVAAGVGNYLRAEILFACRLDPWRLVGELGPDDLDCLGREIPAVAAQAYRTGGFTVAEVVRDRMQGDPSLVYRLGSEWGTRHAVFRRTNLPCLVCGDTVRQQRQFTHTNDDGDQERIIYFCPTCQGTTQPLKPVKKRVRVAQAPASGEEDASPAALPDAASW